MSFNNLAQYQQYLTQVLDEAIAARAITNIFDTNSSQIIPTGIAGEYKVMKIEFGNGLGNYDRDKGFKRGKVTTSWETVKLTKDRSTSFTIDVVDNSEAGNIIAFVMSEFVRTKVVSEVDAYRLSQYAQAIPSSNLITATDTWTPTTAYDAFTTAKDKIFNLGYTDMQDLVCMCTADFKSKLKAKVGADRLISGTNANYNLTTLDDVSLLPVPESLFYDSIDLKDYGTEGTGGGFEPTSGGYGMNFIMCPRSFVENLTKHQTTRIFEPEVNQEADAYKADYRLYFDAFVLDNKKPLFVGCKKQTAVD